MVGEMLVKLKGVSLLAHCAKEYDMSAKLEALTIVGALLKIDVLTEHMKREIRQHDLLTFCLSQVSNFPDPEVDEDILLNAAEII